MIGFVRDLLFKDFWLKLFSLVLALLIWGIIYLDIHRGVSPMMGQPSADIGQQTFRDLPVVILSSAADVHTFRVTPEKVEVVVQAERSLLEKLQAKDIRVLVDLTDIEEARGLRKRVEVTTPTHVAVLSTFPSEVDVTIPPKRLN